MRATVMFGAGDVSSGLVKLGKIDSGVEALNRPGTLKATIELVK